MRWARILETLSRRAPRSMVSRIPCFSSSAGVHAIGCHVRERRGRFHGLDRRQLFGRRLGKQPQRFHRLALQEDERRFDLRRDGGAVDLRDETEARDQEWPSREKFEDLEPLRALADEAMTAVRGGDVARDIGDRPDAMQIRRRRVDDERVLPRKNADLPLFAHRLPRGQDRRRAPDGDGNDGAGKPHDVSHRQDDERLGRQGGDGRRRRGFGGVFGLLKINHPMLPTFPERSSGSPWTPSGAPRCNAPGEAAHDVQICPVAVRFDG